MLQKLFVAKDKEAGVYGVRFFKDILGPRLMII